MRVPTTCKITGTRASYLIDKFFKHPKSDKCVHARFRVRSGLHASAEPLLRGAPKFSVADRLSPRCAEVGLA